MSDPGADVTLLLKRHGDGDPDALSKLIPLVYNELQKLASHYLRGERPGHTLQTTALVHEAYLRLVDRTEVDWKNKGHFFAVAAQTMRRILVDSARKHRALKRGGFARPVRLEQAAVFTEDQAPWHLVIDELLTRLAKLDPKGAKIVELRYFAGLSVTQAAKVLSTSPATVKREWSVTKAWLLREMKNSKRAD